MYCKLHQVKLRFILALIQLPDVALPDYLLSAWASEIVKMYCVVKMTDTQCRPKWKNECSTSAGPSAFKRKPRWNLLLWHRDLCGHFVLKNNLSRKKHFKHVYFKAVSAGLMMPLLKAIYMDPFFESVSVGSSFSQYCGQCYTGCFFSWKHSNEKWRTLILWIIYSDPFYSAHHSEKRSWIKEKKLWAS